MEKEQRPNSFGDRLARLLQAMGTTDQGYGFWADALPETYTELTRELAPQARVVNDKAFIEATTTVIKDLYRSGDVVIIGRGANMILSGSPSVIHIGIQAPLEVRIETMMRREHFTREEAKSYVEELEEARIAFFRKFFKVTPLRDQPVPHGPQHGGNGDGHRRQGNNSRRGGPGPLAAAHSAQNFHPPYRAEMCSGHPGCPTLNPPPRSRIPPPNKNYRPLAGPVVSSLTLSKQVYRLNWGSMYLSSFS